MVKYLVPKSTFNYDIGVESWPKDNPIKFDDTEVGPDYIISGSMMTFYNVDTPEKKIKNDQVI